MRALLIIAAVWALLSADAHAGYALASPPAGWTVAPAGATTERGMYRAAANETWTAAKTVRTTATLNVGGQAVKMPAGMRMAANAGRFAARFAWGNPLLFAAGIALPLAYNYFSQNGFRVVDGAWEEMTVAAYDVRRLSFDACGYSSPVAEGSIGELAAFCQTYQKNVTPDANCYASTSTQITCNRPGFNTINIPTSLVRVQQATWSPTTQASMEGKSESVPLPWGVPNELPKEVEWPVEAPSINPGPDPDMLPRPMEIPLGSPQPVPNTNPQQYTQPLARVVPKPSVDEQWRVEITPLERTSLDPLGVEEPETPAEEPPPDQQDTAKDPGLCEQFPDILACAKLGNAPSAEAVPKKTTELSMSEDEGWNLAAASCPSPRSISIQGRSFSIGFDGLCQFAGGVRPVIVGMAYVAAILIFFGIARKQS